MKIIYKIKTESRISYARTISKLLKLGYVYGALGRHKNWDDIKALTNYGSSVILQGYFECNRVILNGDYNYVSKYSFPKDTKLRTTTLTLTEYIKKFHPLDLVKTSDKLTVL